MQISVSPTGFSAWPQLVGLVRDAFAYMDSRIDPPSSLKKMGIEEFRAKAAEETLIIAEAEGVIIGCAFAALRDDCIYVGKIAVAQSARGKGVARAMIAAAEELARQQGHKYLELQTRVELVENHATFAALGFKKVAESAHPGYDRPTSITMRKRVAGGGGSGRSSRYHTAVAGRVNPLGLPKMPIVDVRPVVSASRKLPDGAAQNLADSIARVLNARTGRVWVRMSELPDGNYAENGTTVRDNELPVFVQVLHADWPDEDARRTEAAALAVAVAASLERQVEQVHIEYAPPGRGRVAFGGKLLV